MNKVRTRFAPSPTGFMHIGNLRSALFEYLIAKHDNGDFILRIEDTDRSRFVEGGIEFIYDTLNLCNFKIDEGPNNPKDVGPYLQSERLELYQKYAEELIEKGEAYYCFCTEERLNELREEADILKIPFMYDGHCKKISIEDAKERIENGEKYVIRQKMPKDGSTSYHDLVYGDINVENNVLEDQILIKSDGYPTYNFANVVDDHLMNITHVVRGNEYLSSTPKYLLLYKSFGWESPLYIHLPHVIKEGGKKLSKREGDASFMDLYNDGYLPEAIINYLALLGWSPIDNQEIFSLDELVEKFDISRISTSPAVYDVMKLRWINSHYIKELDLDRLKSITLPHLKEAYDLSNKSDYFIDGLIKLYQNHISYGKEIVEVSSMFFNDEFQLDEEASKFMMEEGIDNTISVFRDEIENISEWNVENISNAINNTKEKAGVKGRMLFMPIRIKVSGVMHGPELADTIYLFGKEKVLKNLDK